MSTKKKNQKMVVCSKTKKTIKMLLKKEEVIGFAKSVKMLILLSELFVIDVKEKKKNA